MELLSSKAYLKATQCGESGKECAVCGKQTDMRYQVEYQNQGFYPVGPECFKKLAKAGFNVEDTTE